MKILTQLATSTALLAIAVIPSLNATTLDLTEAKDFNLLVWGNATQTNSDIQGGVAVGGNASFSPFSIGGSVPSGNPLNDVVVVGGNLNAINGELKNGSIYVGGTYSGPGYTLNKQAGSVISSNLGTALPFDFAAAKTALSAKSLDYGAAAATGTSTLLSSTLTLTGSSADLNIFNISGSDLDAASGLKLEVTAGSRVLINVSGSSVSFKNAGLSGFSSDLTLFNFYEASTVTLTSIGINGSILAPLADISYNWGEMNGQLIANSFSGTGQLHNSLFKNQEPPVNVPDTGSTALFALLGLVGCGLFRRFNSKRR